MTGILLMKNSTRLLVISLFLFVSCNGSSVPVEVNSSVVNIGAGAILYIQSIARDISKRKLAETAFQAELWQPAEREEERTNA